MKVTITMSDYARMTIRTRRRFDEWLHAEGLIDRHIFEITFDEGRVHVKRYLNGDAKWQVDEHGNLVTEQATYPVRTPPPLEALA